MTELEIKFHAGFWLVTGGTGCGWLVVNRDKATALAGAQEMIDRGPVEITDEMRDYIDRLEIAFMETWQ